MSPLLDRLFGGRPARPSIPVTPPPEFPYPLIEVAGVNALEAWREHDEKWQRHGASAVVIGDLKCVDLWREAFASQPLEVDRILRGAEDLDPSKILADRVAADRAYYEEVEQGAAPEEPLHPHQLTGHTKGVSGIPHKVLYIAKVPTRHAWQIPAYFGFGGWNECPAPEEQVALLRYWHRQYGLRVFSIASDTLEFVVENPPNHPAAAMHLAREQFIYCPDLVYQGFEEIGRLAASLLEAHHWGFWWD